LILERFIQVTGANSCAGGIRITEWAGRHYARWYVPRELHGIKRSRGVQITVCRLQLLRAMNSRGVLAWSLLRRDGVWHASSGMQKSTWRWPRFICAPEAFKAANRGSTQFISTGLITIRNPREARLSFYYLLSVTRGVSGN
jgi:hypothetical protein